MRVCVLLVLVACGPSAAELEKKRAACTFTAGTLPAVTLSGKIGKDLPFDHVVYMMQENRSFDNYYSALPGVDPVPANASNLDASGNVVARFHAPVLCTSDQDHSWTAVHQQWNNGALDGFVTSAGDARAMEYYDQSDIPYYYALARAFAISDRHFASLLGPTWPNRMYALAATSWGIVTNSFPPNADPDRVPYSNLLSELNAAKVQWRDYADPLSEFELFSDTFAENEDKFTNISQFFADAAAGKLPPVSIVESNFIAGPLRTDEHPPSDIQLGQAFTAKVVDAIMHSPNWDKTVFFLTYDEHGGFYDHVPPPTACAPDKLLPPTLAFDHFGLRVPLLVVSPFVKRGYVSHTPGDHASILRFIEARFDLPAMTARDANADPLFDFFDWDHPNTSLPTLPETSIDPDALAACQAKFDR